MSPYGDIGDPNSLDVANRLFFRLYQCSNLLHKNGMRHMEGFGATTQQWAVLGALARPLVHNKGMSVKELMEFLLLSRQNLTAVLDRLEARAWIERMRDPEDGRSRLVRMSPAGDYAWSEMQEPIAEFFSSALSGLSNAEQVQLFQLLDRLRTGLNAA
ncbi:MarR family winged helix-turn-helix transcriptional regulator [Xanthobacter sp. TB0139]|uniref:MarR family winged helix-turn-helix transcriptional regulator n=1 Tax=Xanthobacter sp. TB0139 TaxID=3459178 RepID=UPI004039A129